MYGTLPKFFVVAPDLTIYQAVHGRLFRPGYLFASFGFSLSFA